MPHKDRAVAREYQRLYRLGLRRPRKAEPLAIRLLRRLDRETGPDNPGIGRCWEWMGARNDKGYGLVKHEGRVQLVHRLTLGLALGRPVRPDMFSNHKCDNPPCGRPSHLYEGTAEENARDCVSRGHHVGFETPRTAAEVAAQWGAALEAEFAGE